jgi:predicted CXXCH cytochrome family protein
LVGRVIEPNMLPVPSGTVYLVPSSDVQELSETPIDLFASPDDTALLENDEPIEDLLDTNSDSYAAAEVDADGVYRFDMLPEGSHFVVWAPADDDTEHLPGGDSSKVAFTTDSLIGMQMNIRVSSQPSSAATYVGTSTCMVCHGLHTTTRTAHNVGLQVPGVRSILQDIEPWPDFDDGLAAFETGTTTLYYFNCGTSPSTPEDPSNCEVEVIDPSPRVVSFEVRLRRDTNVPLGVVGRYFVELENQINAQPTQRYDVVLTYGGAVHKQQYLMRRTNNGSFSYFVLPMQYNYQGEFPSPDSDPDPDDWPWRDYRSDLWYDFNTDMLFDRCSSTTSTTCSAPPPPNADESFNAESFDNNCAGCHFTGYRLEGSDADGWSARAVVDTGGAFDYDGDGRVELINTGCEACHGPGSEHLELSPRGSYIVSPGLLTPGRQAAICGSCHSRPLGIGAGMTEPTGLPLSAVNQMPSPGIRRAEFALEHTTRVSGDEQEAFFDSGDPKANYQQYSDLIRSRHYRNPIRISTCTGCHSPHANFKDVYGMDVEDNLNAVCTVCHNSEEFLTVLEHVEAKIPNGIHDSIGREFRCTECHMVPTAKSGASVPALEDVLPSSAPPVQYYWNDIASHRLKVTGRDRFAEQPVAATNKCAPCHGGFFPN